MLLGGWQATANNPEMVLLVLVDMDLPEQYHCCGVLSISRPLRHVPVTEFATLHGLPPGDPKGPSPHVTGAVPAAVDHQQLSCTGAPWRQGNWLGPS